MGECFVSRTVALRSFDVDTTILCSHREQVVDYNNLCASCLFLEDGQLKKVSVVTNGNEDANLVDWVSDSYFHQLQSVVVGSKVLITQNLENGAANGAQRRCFMSGCKVRCDTRVA